MTREQEAIERMAKALLRDGLHRENVHGGLMSDEAYAALIGGIVLDALLSPSPCPTCGGTGEVIEGQPPHQARVHCIKCGGTGTVPPLLRWNEAPDV